MKQTEDKRINQSSQLQATEAVAEDSTRQTQAGNVGFRLNRRWLW